MGRMADIIKHPSLRDPEAVARRGDFELLRDPDPAERTRLGIAVAMLGVRRVREEAARIREQLANQRKIVD